MLGLAPLSAQEMSAAGGGEHPPARLLDEADLFETEREAVLTARLGEFREATGYPVGVVVYDTLIGRDLPEVGREFGERWIGEGPGVVLAIEADAGRWHLEWVDAPGTRTEAGEWVPASGALDLTQPEQLAVRNRLRGLGELEPGSPDGVAERVWVLVESLETLFAESRDGSRLSSERARLWALGIGMLAAAALCVMIVALLLRRADRKEGTRFDFPDIAVGRRLKAPRGGGKLSSRSFRETSGGA